MGKFNRDNDRSFGNSRGGNLRFGGQDSRQGGFGGNRDGGSRFGERRDIVMHDAVCADCKKNCQVPFRPSNDKPVYCKDCFNERGGPSKSSFNNFPKKDFGPRPQVSPSFATNKSDDGVKKLLEAINTKLDSLIKTIEVSSKPVSVEVKEKKLAKEPADNKKVKSAIKKVLAKK
ncbi:MAG: CxxC-x17-CxxC domain-containing protein [Minisyncoccia bacterium]